MACYVEITAGPSAGDEYAKVLVTDDGSAIVYTGASPHGQGHHTAFSMIASDTLGIPMEQITVVHGDTDVVAKGVGTFGSRSLQLGGAAVARSAGEVRDLARSVAASLLEAAVDDVVLDAEHGVFHVAGVPAVTAPGTRWRWRRAAASRRRATSRRRSRRSRSAPTSPSSRSTPRPARCGCGGWWRATTPARILNPLLADGQRHGGIAQGVAQALYEEVRYDDIGNPQTANLADYGMVSAAELPSFELVALETPTWVNPLGAKGIGESGTIGSTPAVQTAVVDALAHLGVRHVDIPCTSERVWQAIHTPTSPDPRTGCSRRRDGRLLHPVRSVSGPCDRGMIPGGTGQRRQQRGEDQCRSPSR